MLKKHNHHFVPRLILRKFDEKLTTYDLNSKKVKYEQELEKVFNSRDLYTQEIENLFNEKIENEFAHLLNKNILKASNECRFTRIEVNKIKKFLLLGMLRTMSGEEYSFHRKEVTEKTVKIYFNFEEKNIDALSAYDYWMRTLKSILESKSLMEVKDHPLATNKAVYWANIFNSSYIAIWDSSDVYEDFIVMDHGMTSEHEITRFADPINNDAIKKGYLLSKTIFFDKKPQIKEDINAFQIYYNLLLANDCMTENMYLFSISKNRMAALINPFFRLYDKNPDENTSFLPEPDIWTTRITDKNLFKKNRNEYVGDFQNGELNDNDVFIYDIHSMKLLDVLYVNCLVLDRIHDKLGFSESKGIVRSVAMYKHLNNPRNDYTDLLKEFDSMGYSIKISDEIIRHAISVSNERILTSKESNYVTLFLQAREMNAKT